MTNRFIRTPIAFADEVPRDASPKTNPNFLFGTRAFNTVYAASADLYKKFIGMYHVNSVLRLVGMTDVPLIISECLQNMDLKVRVSRDPSVFLLFSTLNGLLPVCLPV